jgi:hypothetical protein
MLLEFPLVFLCLCSPVVFVSSGLLLEDTTRLGLTTSRWCDPLTACYGSFQLLAPFLWESLLNCYWHIWGCNHGSVHPRKCRGIFSGDGCKSVLSCYVFDRGWWLVSAVVTVNLQRVLFAVMICLLSAVVYCWIRRERECMLFEYLLHVSSSIYIG